MTSFSPLGNPSRYTPNIDRSRLKKRGCRSGRNGMEDLRCRISVWKPGGKEGFDIEGVLAWVSGWRSGKGPDIRGV
jgi:hypothetical protein